MSLNEQDIEEKLNEIYNIDIDVKWRDFRIYDVFFKIKIQNELKLGSIAIMIDSTQTFESNILMITNKIDNEILKLLKEKE